LAALATRSRRRRRKTALPILMDVSCLGLVSRVGLSAHRSRRGAVVGLAIAVHAHEREQQKHADDRADEALERG
jgi:hypothetical protein